MIDSQVKKTFGSWVKFSLEMSEDKTNFKRKILRNINRINKWLKPLNLEIKIVKSKN